VTTPYIWMGVIPNFCLAILWPDMGLISFLALVIICSVSVNFIKRRNIHSDHAVRMFVIVVALQIIWSIINILDVWANFSINQSFHKINSLLINLLVIQPFSYRGMPVVFWTLFPLLSFYILFILLLKPISNWWKTLPLWGVVLVNLIIGSILLIASIIVKESYFNLRLNQFFRQYSFIVGFQLALYWDEIAKSYTRYQVYILIVSTFVMYLMMLEIYIGIHEIVFMFTSMISAWIAGGIVLSVMHFGLLRKVFSSRLLTIAGSHAYGVFLFQSPILHYANIYVLRNNISTSALLFIVPAATLLMSWVALRVVDFKIK
jgi:peptidoglycan/LPS O-acetylase OafA/YrhL